MGWGGGQEKVDCTFQVVRSHPRGPLSEGESDSPAWDTVSWQARATALGAHIGQMNYRNSQPQVYHRIRSSSAFTDIHGKEVRFSFLVSARSQQGPQSSTAPGLGGDSDT